VVSCRRHGNEIGIDLGGGLHYNKRWGALVKAGGSVLLTWSLCPLPPPRQWQEAARAIGLQIQVLNASTSREIDAAFASLERERPGALFVGAGAFFGSWRVQLVTLATRDRIPNCRSRRADELWNRHPGQLSSNRRLYR
jgi:hypothetical protein